MNIVMKLIVQRLTLALYIIIIHYTLVPFELIYVIAIVPMLKGISYTYVSSYFDFVFLIDDVNIYILASKTCIVNWIDQFR
jgi:hypothetical protein